MVVPCRRVTVVAGGKPAPAARGGILAPVTPPLDVDAPVVANHRLSDSYNVLELEAPGIAARVQPGQFVMVKRALGREPLLRRPFSVFEVLRDDGGTVRGLSLLSKVVGTVTGELFAVEAGERIQCLGPLGRSFRVIHPPAVAWMVAGGVGLAPFATLAEELRARSVETTLFYGGRTAGDLYRVPFFETLGVRVMLTTENGSRGEKGRVTVPLARELTAMAERDGGNRPVQIYACGPTPMMRAVAELVAARASGAADHTAAGGTLADQAMVGLEVSLEPVMGCGMGGCYSCVVPVTDNGTRFVRGCIDGPVFEGTRVAWTHLT